MVRSALMQNTMLTFQILPLTAPPAWGLTGLGVLEREIGKANMLETLALSQTQELSSHLTNDAA